MPGLGRWDDSSAHILVGRRVDRPRGEQRVLFHRVGGGFCHPEVRLRPVQQLQQPQLVIQLQPLKLQPLQQLEFLFQLQQFVQLEFLFQFQQLLFQLQQLILQFEQLVQLQLVLQQFQFVQLEFVQFFQQLV